MTTLSFTQARDEILELFKAAWDTTGLGVVYDDAPTDTPTRAELANENVTGWARATVRHALGQQSSLANGTDGKRRYIREGNFIVQIFTPAGTGLRTADQYAKVVADALEGQETPGGVWFRNVSYREVGRDGPWYQTNVSATFQYDEVK